MVKSFPSEFYITSATVIPVLYIALVVGAGSLDDAILTAAQRAAHRQPRRRRDTAIALLAPVAAYSPLGVGVLGEAIALITLFEGSDTVTTRIIVLIMTLVLVATAAGGPFIRWRRVQRKVSTLIRKTGHSRTAAASPQEAPGDADE